MGNDLTDYRGGALADWSPSAEGRATHGSPDSALTFSQDFYNALDRSVPDQVLAKWKSWPGSDAHYLRVAVDSVMVLDGLRGMGADNTLNELVWRYERLPEGVQAALWLEWSTGAEGYARMLPDRLLEDIWATKEGKYLRRVWGHGLKADRKMSSAVSRLNRIRENLSGWGNRELDSFMRGLSSHALACALCTLA